MKALHDITAPDPWAGFFNPDAPVRTWDEAGVVGREAWQRAFREMEQAPVLPDYQRRYLEGTFWQDPRRQRDFYFYEPTRWPANDPLYNWPDPLDQRPPQMTNTRDVVGRLQRDAMTLRAAGLNERYALTANRAELHALVRAGYLYEGALPIFEGFRIALTD